MTNEDLLTASNVDKMACMWADTWIKAWNSGYNHAENVRIDWFYKKIRFIAQYPTPGIGLPCEIKLDYLVDSSTLVEDALKWYTNSIFNSVPHTLHLMISKRQLVKRGWTKSQIRLLGSSDKEEYTSFRKTGPKTQLFSEEKIRRIELSGEFERLKARKVKIIPSKTNCVDNLISTQKLMRLGWTSHLIKQLMPIPDKIIDGMKSGQKIKLYSYERAYKLLPEMRNKTWLITEYQNFERERIYNLRRSK